MKFQPVTPETCSKVLEIFLSNRIEKDALNPERKRIFHDDWVKHMELPIREILDLIAPENTVDEFVHYLNNTFGGRVFRNLRLDPHKEDDLYDQAEVNSRASGEREVTWCYNHFGEDLKYPLEGELLMKLIIEAYKSYSKDLDFCGRPTALPFITSVMMPCANWAPAIITAYAFLEARIAQAGFRN